MSRRRGSLTVVGTGIDAATQLTPGARAFLERSDEVLYLVADPLAALRILELNPRARSLDPHYAPDRDRLETYAAMVDEILAAVLAGKDVCAVFYGHPALFVAPGRAAVERARAAGLPARILPAVSSLDCLFADLELDPAHGGLQLYEATDFFQREPPVDPGVTLVLLQAGTLGEQRGSVDAAVGARFRRLLERLAALYGPGREAVLYEASPYPLAPPAVHRFRLGDPDVEPTLLATLCVPAQPTPTAPLRRNASA